MKTNPAKKVRALVEMSFDLHAQALDFCRQSPQSYTLSGLIRAALIEKIERESRAT